MPQDETNHEDELIALVAKGDERAFNQLVQRHGPRLHALATRYTGSSADAEEIAQEALFRLWRQASTWQSGSAKLSTWLFRITTNLCIDLVRKRKRQADQSSADPPDLMDEQPDSSTQLAARQELELIQQEIDTLPDKQKMALILSIQQEKSHTEIAQILNSSTGAVEQLLVRARRSLRQAYRRIK